uniref:Uncharacterized protein n=1 Tax=Helianthus annuus TaxID=4232 RepID=A0A251S3S2_HELAN
MVQLIAVILGHLWTSEHPRIRARIELLLKQQKLTKNDVKNVLQEYHDNIGDLDGPDEKRKHRPRSRSLSQLLRTLGKRSVQVKFSYFRIKIRLNDMSDDCAS